MGVTRVQRITNPKSGQVEDQVVNTFHFVKGDDHTDLVAGDVTAVADALDQFFNVVVGGGTPVRNFLAESTMATQKHAYKFYNMDDASPRVPYAQPPAQNVTPIISTAALPSEVACCLSFRGLQASGMNMARARGRVFIGPLNTSAMEVDATTGQPRVAAAMQTALCASANRMRDTLAAGPNLINWCVYSPTTRNGAGDAFDAVTICAIAWVDNAFDTQRRRGLKASARTTIDMFA